MHVQFTGLPSGVKLGLYTSFEADQTTSASSFRILQGRQQRGTVPRQHTVCEATKTFYEQLDVPKTADAKTIKKAFKKMALKYHPDVNKEVRTLASLHCCVRLTQTCKLHE